jgi:hypothetical protein
MNNISQILYHRFVEKEKNFSFFSKKFNLNKSDFDKNYKSILRAKLVFADELIIKAFKLFESKIISDKKIFEWNNKNPQEIAKIYSFSAYSRLDENGKSIKSMENFNMFYYDIKEQYYSQTKSNLQFDLTWIRENNIIKQDDFVCFYCGINEEILSELYNDQKYTCKTKRNRGAWFELDRRDSSKENNIYSKENMVLCCYFCNNHKSDVISSYDMRRYFGEQMFRFLIDKYKTIIKTK